MAAGKPATGELDKDIEIRDLIEEANFSKCCELASCNEVGNVLYWYIYDENNKQLQTMENNTGKYICNNLTKEDNIK